MIKDKRTCFIQYLDGNNLNHLADVRWAKKQKTMQEWLTNGGDCPLPDDWTLDDERIIAHLTVGEESRVAGRRNLPSSVLSARHRHIHKLVLPGYGHVRVSYLELLSTFSLANMYCE